jgi:hypothetical protein
VNILPIFEAPKPIQLKRNPRLLIFSIVCLSAILSCKKNDSDVNQPLTCILAKAFYFDSGGAISDSVIYTYTGAHITKLANAAGYATLEYTADRVTRRNFYDGNSTTPNAYDVAAYNGDGTLSSIKSYIIFGTAIQYAQYDFTYNGGKLSKLDVQQYDINSSQLELSSSSTFTYSGNNISQSVTTYYDPAGGPPDIVTLAYSFDNNENYFVKNNAIFTDYVFVDALDGSIAPLVFSANNVTKVTEGVDETLLAYTLDSNQNFYEFLFDGEKYSRYIYDCN